MQHKFILSSLLLLLLSLSLSCNPFSRRAEYVEQVKALMCQDAYELMMSASPIPKFVIELFDGDKTKKTVCTCLLPIVDEDLVQYEDEELYQMTLHKKKRDTALRQLLLTHRNTFYPCVKEQSGDFYDKIIQPFMKWLEERKDDVIELVN